MLFLLNYFILTFLAFIIFIDSDTTNKIIPDYSSFSIITWVVGAVLPMTVMGEWSPCPYIDNSLPQFD